MGAGGVINFSVGICDGAPSTAHSSLCFFCLVFAMLLCESVYMCLVVTCWEGADLLAHVCGVYC